MILTIELIVISLHSINLLNNLVSLLIRFFLGTNNLCSKLSGVNEIIYKLSHFYLQKYAFLFIILSLFPSYSMVAWSDLAQRKAILTILSFSDLSNHSNGLCFELELL